MKTGDDIEKLFKERFQDAEVSPSQDIWAKLEAKIENNGVESLYQAAFKNAEVRPAASFMEKVVFQYSHSVHSLHLSSIPSIFIMLQ